MSAEQATNSAHSAADPAAPTTPALRWASSKTHEQRLSRLEHRSPQQVPEETLALLEESGFDLIVASATNGNSDAFFPSRVYPMLSGVDPERVPRLIELCHANDVMVISWVCFNVQDVMAGDPQRLARYQPAQVFPQWRMRYIEDGATDHLPAVGMCALSSPWRQEHAKFLLEIMGLGFDGLWFDGVFSMGLPGRRAGCVCDFCRARFAEDTGLDLPRRVDWSDPAFKRWIAWRYDRMAETMDFFTRTVRSSYPGAPITFNTHSWPSATGAWQRAMSCRRYPSVAASFHSGLFPTNGIQAHPLHARVVRAMGGEGADMWQPIFATRHALWTPEVPPHEPTLRYHALTCVADGIAPWFGGPNHFMDVFRDIGPRVERLRPFYGGDDLDFCAIVASDRTKDFYGERDAAHRAVCFEDIHGLAAMLAQHQILHQVIFDEDLERGDLGRFRVLVLSNIACLSDRALEHLEAYVRAGGTLIATFETGRYNEWGELRPASPPLFGARVTERVGVESPQRPVREGVNAEAVETRPPPGSAATAFTYRPLDLIDPTWNPQGPARVVFSGPFTRFEPFPGAEVCATAVGPGATRPGEPAIAERRLGAGRVVYFGDDLGCAYFRWPFADARRILATLIRQAGPPLTVAAPTVVLASAQRRRRPDGAGELLVHLVNLPPATNRMGNPAARPTVDDVVPVCGIRVTLHAFRAVQARAGSTGALLPLEGTPEGQTVEVGSIDDHEVVVFSLAG